jgi:large subunit ribosomal protein L9
LKSFFYVIFLSLESLTKRRRKRIYFLSIKRNVQMRVYMLKDVEKVGMAGQVVKVSDGYASNFLIPRKLAIKVEGNNVTFFEKRIQKAEATSKVLGSKAAMLAERIRNLHVTLKERVHDEGKLYGAVGADEIVELLKQRDINVNKKQIEFPKSIKTVGEHRVIVRLSSKLRPELTLKVVGQE